MTLSHSVSSVFQEKINIEDLYELLETIFMKKKIAASSPETNYVIVIAA